MRVFPSRTQRPEADSLLRIAASVIEKSDRQNPADAVLRFELKSAKGISREHARQISSSVFAYYRWRGWLDAKERVPKQVQRAIQLDELFRADPNSISDADLLRAVPGWVGEHFEPTTKWLRSLQTIPALWLRAKAGQGRALAQKLGDCEAHASGALPDALGYFGSKDLFRTKEFQAGEFELQDIDSQVVGQICDPRPGEIWWDACAGEGGKTLHLCDLMRNRGLVWASDRAEWRLKRLRQRAARAGAFNYRSAVWDGSANLPTKTRFDGILVDAPCSGIGTWQRNPHARWTTTGDDIEELAAVQRQLLANVIPALKPGGRLVYSVCTLSRAETSGVAERIGNEFPRLKSMMINNPLDQASSAAEKLWLLPEATCGNGMFICGWRIGKA